MKKLLLVLILITLSSTCLLATQAIKYGRFTQHQAMNEHTGEDCVAYIDTSKINGYVHIMYCDEKITVVFVGGGMINLKGWVHPNE